jgi:hypothetical protein
MLSDFAHDHPLKIITIRSDTPHDDVRDKEQRDLPLGRRRFAGHQDRPWK